MSTTFRPVSSQILERKRSWCVYLVNSIHSLCVVHRFKVNYGTGYVAQLVKLKAIDSIISLN